MTIKNNSVIGQINFLRGDFHIASHEKAKVVRGKT